MTGKLYGIGVGPGDPELLTLKAVRLIRECEVIAVPGQKKEETAAYQIALHALPGLSEKEALEIHMPMTKEAQKLEESHQQAFWQVAKVLEEGKDVAFLTLGDPCIYSTYIYIHQRIQKAGFQTEIVNGIPSFCAAAAKLNQGLVEQAQMLHVIPSSYGIEEALHLPGTKVLMKAGRKIGKIKQRLLEENVEAVMVENCGMAKEQVYPSTREIPKEAGYYSLIIIKEQ